ncbi:MAG: carbohydrate ABC transporter permease [Clostridiaceae bacterium]|nr:carbohydrate ABC transporter permease [Clostridiaceae bacterium]
MKKTKPGKIGLLIILFAFAAFQIYPLVWMFFFSLKSNAENFYTNVAGIPIVWRWENYKNVLIDGGLITYFINSLIYTVITLFVSGILSSMTAYAIARLKWKLSNFVYTLFILGIMIPIQAALLPLFIVLDKIHLLDSYWALLIPYIAFAIPMSILILTSFYKSIPMELEEAAFIDGCSIYKTFFKIILPIVKPAIATVSIFTFLGTWNELIFANTFVNSSKYRTLTVGIMSLNGQHATDWGLIGAGMVIATLPTLIIYIILNRQVQESLVAGAVKG